MKNLKNKMESCIINTPLGFARLEGDRDGIKSITVLNNEMSVSDVIPEILEDAVRQLDEYFKEERIKFSLKLNAQGTEFQKRVWKELLNIPYGKTVSYLELSKRLGDVKAIRAAASANGKTHCGLLCHAIVLLVVMVV